MEVEIIKEQSSIDKATVDIQVATAKKFPRDIEGVTKNIFKTVTQDRNIARECFYAIKKDNKIIHGATIRLAEIVAHNFGNLRIQGKILSKNQKTVTLEGIAWDLEKNVAYSSQAERSITKKNGERYSESMITLTVNAGLSIAIRNVIFNVFFICIFNSRKIKFFNFYKFSIIFPFSKYINIKSIF